MVTSLFSAIQQPDAQTKLDRMSESLSKLPLAHHGTLVILIQHLKKVMDFDSKTDINNMAITFAPNLMWAPLKLQVTKFQQYNSLDPKNRSEIIVFSRTALAGSA